MLPLAPTGGTLRIDRTFTAGQLREQTKTGDGRDVPIVAPLAADLIALRDSIEFDPDALVCPFEAGAPIRRENWQRRICDPAAKRTGVPWATPYSGRHTCVSLQIRAGVNPLTVAGWAGTSPGIVWEHYARVFARSQTAERVPLADALIEARRAIRPTVV